MKFNAFHLFITFLIPLFQSCAVLSLFNAGTVNVKYASSQATFNNQLYENKRHLRSASFSIRNAQHPEGYGPWNLNLRVSPSINLDRANYQTGAVYLSDTGELRRYPDVAYHRLATIGNLKLTLHTPIGAFSAAAGMGLSVYRLDDDNGLNTVRTGVITRYDLAWTIFLSKHFFVLFGTRVYREDGNEFRQGAVRLGYFWGHRSK